MELNKDSQFIYDNGMASDDAEKCNQRLAKAMQKADPIGGADLQY